MPTRRMLVDAIHPEETRVVVTSGNRLEEFDFESATRRQLRGNIYLAKVTRVEPSLQAAFVDYGGNRHGFLAFSEIHPDYYQIPLADREALLAEEEEEVREDLSEVEQPSTAKSKSAENDDEKADDGDTNSNGEDDDDHGESAQFDEVGTEDALEEVPERKRKKPRTYKIQEVIKRRQVLLVQVVKEERGNKGAALTTYLSLAGRYSVLMPNTARGGGISRKITNAADRKRLKQIAGELDVQKGMGVILRTAGASRTKAEIKRDFEYLLRLWENVRSLTLESTAPCLVYEEGSLIKRSIRDLYNKEITEVLVSGDSAYREAKDFMRMIMPSHAKNVQPFKDDQPIFSKFNVEEQLDSMFSPKVNLPSGGYLVINPTEALVSVDVNSGKATKEHNIEDTALQTNMEAAAELARQLRLRDMAGLVVIDFIDMEEKRNIRNVERKLKDSLKNDRARIQVGRISHFGLLEMSRQRIRFGVLESSTNACPTCNGTGLVRSVESLALMVMRAIEDQVMRRPGQAINVKVASEVALYILNAKRPALSVLEQRYNLAISITAEPHMHGDQFTIEKGDPYDNGEPRLTNHVQVDSAPVIDLPQDDEDEPKEDKEEKPSRRRKRRRGKGRDRDENNQNQSDDQDNSDKAEANAQESKAGDQDHKSDDDDNDGQPKKRRRRGRRGGRRNRRNQDNDNNANQSGEQRADSENADQQQKADEKTDQQPANAEKLEAPANFDQEAIEAVEESSTRVKNPNDLDAEVSKEAALADAKVESKAESLDDEDAKAAPKPKRRTRRKKAEESDAKAEPAAENKSEAKPEAPTDADAEEKPKRRRAPRKRVKKDDEKPQQDQAVKAPEVREEPQQPPKEKPKKAEPQEDGIIVTSTTVKEDQGDESQSKEKAKKGWWQRGFF
ncbi:Rne/Rng family ribonuclease [Maritalea mediterranea]|uniref:Ribonuclease E n=1 Tax=Maritalea mediterranea TaxID=2909667 RepID=A0ABS9EEG2_9HYPH|nr:Rne/Rng family ribonuclease [Maritalea mediterranea]MCF4099841.1 Rne/Rng family ribonuclease [Maritalea mediterranea]